MVPATHGRVVTFEVLGRVRRFEDGARRQLRLLGKLRFSKNSEGIGPRLLVRLAHVLAPVDLLGRRESTPNDLGGPGVIDATRLNLGRRYRPAPDERGLERTCRVLGVPWRESRQTQGTGDTLTETIKETHRGAESGQTLSKALTCRC